MLRRGSKGKEVLELQERLNRFSSFSLNVDGHFGEHTEAAVEIFQENHGLLVDGIVGPKTWGLLREVRPPLSSDLFEKHRYLKIASSSSRSDLEEAVLKRAIEDIGKKESPLGSNRGPEIAHLVDGYNEYWRIPGLSSPPWCAIAVSSWIKLGLQAPSWEHIPFRKWFGAVSQLYNWANKNKCIFQPNERLIRGGDIFIMDRVGSGSDRSSNQVMRRGHTGLILEDEGDRLLTIEGNVSNRVKVCSRPKSMIKGIITWS